MSVSQRLPKRRIVGGKPDGVAKAGGGMGELPVAAERQAAVDVNLGQIGSKPDRLGISSVCFSPLIQSPVSITEIIEAGREARPDANRFQAMRKPLLRVALIDQALAEIRLRLRTLWVESDGKLKSFQGFVVLALLPEYCSEVVPSHCKRGTNMERGTEEASGLFEPTERLQSQAEIVPGLRTIHFEGSAVAQQSMACSYWPSAR